MGVLLLLAHLLSQVNRQNSFALAVHRQLQIRHHFGLEERRRSCYQTVPAQHEQFDIDILTWLQHWVQPGCYLSFGAKVGLQHCLIPHQVVLLELRRLCCPFCPWQHLQFDTDIWNLIYHVSHFRWPLGGPVAVIHLTTLSKPGRRLIQPLVKGALLEVTLEQSQPRLVKLGLIQE